MCRKIKQHFFICLSFSFCLITCKASDIQGVHADRVYADLIRLSHSAFDIQQVEKLSGTRLIFAGKGSITPEEVYRSTGSLRVPYFDLQYERRNHGSWVGITLSIDHKYCLSPADLNTFFPMGEGVPRASDHFADNEFEIGFSSNDRTIWIVYQNNNGGRCARRFSVEATK